MKKIIELIHKYMASIAEVLVGIALIILTILIYRDILNAKASDIIFYIFGIIFSAGAGLACILDVVEYYCRK